MPTNILMLAALCLVSMACGAASVRFYPKADIEATVIIDGSTARIRITRNNLCREQEVSFETEKPINLVLDDYNFDGAVDVSFWSIDEGKGTYEIHHPYIFDEKRLGFQEIKSNCGEEFLNLRIDRKSKLLLSTHFSGDRPAICKTSSASQLLPLRVRDCQ